MAVGSSVKYVPDKPRGLGQEALLTPEYQAIFEANFKDVAEAVKVLIRLLGAFRRECGA
jgi:hypothetical protein